MDNLDIAAIEAAEEAAEWDAMVRQEAHARDNAAYSSGTDWEGSAAQANYEVATARYA